MPRWPSPCGCSVVSRPARSPRGSSCPRQQWPSGSPGQAEDQGQSDPIPRPGRCRAAQPAPRCTRHAPPGPQRGLPSLKPGQRHRGRSVRRGDQARTDPGIADAGRARGARGAGPARADGSDRRPSCRAGQRRSARATAGPGPHQMGPRADHRRPRHRPSLPAPGPSRRRQLLAAINAVHTDAACAAETDWTQIVQLYDQLYTVTPTPVVALNRAIAVAVVDGPAAALAILNRLDLAGGRAFHAARADLLRREHRSIEAVQAYTRAIDLAAGPAEQAYLRSRRADLLSSWFTQQPHQERPRVRLRCCTPVRRPLNPCLATTRPHQGRSLEAALGPTRWT